MSAPDASSGVSGWTDSHCHLDMIDDPAAVDRARAAGVVRMVCVGTDLASSRRALQIAHDHADVFATVGLHPHDASRWDEERDELIALAASSARVVGIGECGLDFHYMHSPAESQVVAFRAQIRLARETDRALVIHTRDAWDATWSVLEDEPLPPRTVFHCFTGGPEEARRALATGAVLSFSGIVSFANAQEVRDAAALTPADRLLVETDAPFLAPVPHRGRPNEPAWVAHVGTAVARVRGTDPADVAASTSATAAHVFGI